MKPKYEPRTYEQHVGLLVEECGEACAAAGKLLRWGPDSCNPECGACGQAEVAADHRVPERGPTYHRFVPQTETNEQWLLRELADVERAVWFMRGKINERLLTMATVGDALVKEGE